MRPLPTVCVRPACPCNSGLLTTDEGYGASNIEVADKLKVAALLHRKPMREYMLEVLEAHLKELERKGITLTLPKGK